MKSIPNVEPKIPATAAERQRKRKVKLLSDSVDKRRILTVTGAFLALLERQELTIAETIAGLKAMIAEYD